MSFLTDPRNDTVTLTRGGMWTKEWLPDPGKVWPTGTTHTVFLDTSGGTIADLAGTVEDAKISYSSPPADTDDIPAGAGFETFLVTDDGPYKIRYGKVIRKEVSFPDAPGKTSTYHAMLFTDDFQRAALGSKWVAVKGRSSIHANTLFGQPSGVNVDFGLLYQQSAIRYFAPLTGDSIKTVFTLLRSNYDGYTTVVLCADQGFTSFLGVQFDGSSFTAQDNINIVTGSGVRPAADMVIKAQYPVPGGLKVYDRYTAVYDAGSNTVLIYQGSNLDPLLQWTDNAAVVPHGPGYRYTGFCFSADLLSSGPQITDWAAQDAAGAANLGIPIPEYVAPLDGGTP